MPTANPILIPELRVMLGDGDANGWRATFTAATHPLFQFRLQIRLTRCALKTRRAEECPAFE
jgi:hypothetical protein